MKTALIAIVLAATSAAPAALARECALITQDIEVHKKKIARDSNAYWTQRKAYIGMKAAPQAAMSAQRVAVAQTEANSAKASMPMTLGSFAALLSEAKKQNCLTKEQLRAAREPAFDLARSVNFDEVPKELSTEGKPLASKAPRMPVK